MQDGDEKWVSWLSELFAFFSGCQFKHIFKEHRHYVVTKCNKSAVSFLSKFFTDEGAWLPFEIYLLELYFAFIFLFFFRPTGFWAYTMSLEIVILCSWKFRDSSSNICIIWFHGGAFTLNLCCICDIHANLKYLLGFILFYFF